VRGGLSSGATRDYAFGVTPIPADPHEPAPPELTMRDGRKVKLNVPGLEPRGGPHATEERGAAEPPRDDPRPPLDPNVGAPG
jgi:hypothetical protein